MIARKAICAATAVAILALITLIPTQAAKIDLGVYKAASSKCLFGMMVATTITGAGTAGTHEECAAALGATGDLATECQPLTQSALPAGWLIAGFRTFEQCTRHYWTCV